LASTLTLEVALGLLETLAHGADGFGDDAGRLDDAKVEVLPVPLDA